MSSLGIFNKDTQSYQKIAGSTGAAMLDTEMSDTSVNPVQNKVIKKYVDSKQVEVDIASKDKAGIVKPADGLVVAEDGTLKVNLDGTTLTIDQVNNVIKLADTLKEKISGALPADNVVNNLTTAEAGFALDARQGNPNVSGSLGAQITAINRKWNDSSSHGPVLTAKSPFSGNIEYVVRFGMCTVYISDVTAPSSQEDGTIVEGIPVPSISGTWLIHDSTHAYDSAKLGARVSVIPGQNILLCHKLSGCTKLDGSFSYPINV